MANTVSLLSQVCDAQTRNSTLAGDDLRNAGREIAALAVGEGYAVMAADEAGERLIGAALLADDRVRAADASHRLDGQSVLMVAGYLAGTSGMALKAALVRSLGALHVRATVLGSSGVRVDGCEQVTAIRTQPRLIALQGHDNGEGRGLFGGR